MKKSRPVWQQDKQKRLLSISGFVDLQVNGYKGIDFSSNQLTADAVAWVCRELAAAGTTAFLATLVTCPPDVYQRNLGIIARICARNEFRRHLLGIHLEGPFISPEKGFVGAHNAA